SHVSAAGDRLAELFEQHGRMVYGLCRALLRDADDADDATQAAFLSAYTSLLGGSVVREPAAWLATIARNECSSRAKARMREPLPLFESDLALAPGLHVELDRKHAVKELRASIAGLPEKQREAVVLRDLYGLPYSEVGAALGVSVASVESLLFRARRSLRGSLKPLVSGVLTVPISVREGIARALPEFATGAAASGGAGGGALGLGLLAKFAGGPAAVKATAGLAAAVAAGSMAITGVVGVDAPRSTAERAAAAVTSLPTAAEHQAPGIERTELAAFTSPARAPIAEAGARSGAAAAAASSESRGHGRTGGGEGEADDSGSGGGHSDARAAPGSQGTARDDGLEREDGEAEISAADDDTEGSDDLSSGGGTSSASGSESDGSASSGSSGEHVLEQESPEDGKSESSGSGYGDVDHAEESEPVAPS
ncbi:MAG: sigma-70 family RNA polymerase sigma factor, partial [Thermoleophilia bacterium]|nr:sigma-70 family RNA polymerase sigma factor [Thermoleophilia bacterium]